MTHLQEPQPTNQPDNEPQTVAPEVGAEPALEWTLAEEKIDRELEAAETDADRTYWEDMQGKLDSNNHEDWEEIYNLGVEENARIEAELEDDRPDFGDEEVGRWTDEEMYDTEDPLASDVDTWVHPNKTRTEEQEAYDDRHMPNPH